MVKTQANSNFHTVTKGSVFDERRGDKRFEEYRRKWAEYPRNFITGDFPIHLDIESTSFCNLRCPFCATTFDEWGPADKGFMDFDMFKRIIDEGLSHGLFSIKLSVRGEPLLHKGLAHMIDYAKRSGIIDIYFNTNAVLMSDEIIRRLIEVKLDRISISFEGATKEVYERYRIGAEYEKVVDNIKNLRRIRDSENVKHPQIRVQTVLLPEIRSSFDQYVRFWGDIADEVAYLDARDESARQAETDPDARESQAADWACPFLWQRMMILWDGSTYPCLMHGVKDGEGIRLGNVRRKSLYEMWHGDAANRFRELHKEGSSHRIDECAKCSYRVMELAKLDRGEA